MQQYSDDNDPYRSDDPRWGGEDPYDSEDAREGEDTYGRDEDPDSGGEDLYSGDDSQWGEDPARGEDPYDSEDVDEHGDTYSGGEDPDIGSEDRYSGEDPYGSEDPDVSDTDKDDDEDDDEDNEDEDDEGEDKDEDEDESELESEGDIGLDDVDVEDDEVDENEVDGDEVDEDEDEDDEDEVDEDEVDEDDGVEVDEDEVEGNEVDEDEDEDVDDDDEAEDESEDNDVDVDDEYEEEEADIDEGEGVDVDVDDEDTDEVDEASEANKSSDVDHASDADEAYEAYEAYEALHVNEDSGCDDGFSSDDNSRSHSSFSSRSNGQPSYNIFTNIINVNTTEVHATEVLPMQENDHKDVNNDDSHLRRQPLSHPGPNDPPHERQPSNGLPPKKDGNNNNFRPHQSPNPTQPQKVGNKHDAHPGPRLGPNDPPSGHKSKTPKGPRPKKDSNNNNPHPRQPPNPPQPKKVGKTHAGLRLGPNDLHPGHQPPNHPRPKKDGNNNNPRLPPNPPHPKKVGNNHDAHPRPRGSRLGPNDPPTGHQLPNCLRPKKYGNNNDSRPRQLPNPLQPQKVSNNDDPHPEPSLGPNDLPSGQQLPNHPRPKKDGNNNSDPRLRQPPNPQQPKKVGNNRDLRPRPKPLNRPPPNSEHGKKLETHANESHSGITITRNEQKVRSPNGQPDHPKDGALDCADDKHGASRDKASKVNGQSLYDIKIQVFPTVWAASVAGDLHTAEELLTQEIDKDGSKDDSYAIRSVVRARNLEWDNALQDAVKSIAIQPSLWGYVSKGLALCGNKQLWDAMEAFDLAITFSDRDPVTIDLLLLIKAVVIFNAGRHNEALRRVQRFATADQHSDALRCSMVDAYLRVQLAMITFQNGLYSKAADELTASITTITDLFSPTALLEPRWKIFTLLFGWNFDTLWQTINQRRCDALLHADRVTEAVKSFQYMMSMIDDNTKSGCLEWSSAFKKDCTARCVAKGDEALAASNYEMAIELYSAAITLDSSHDSFFTRRSSAYLARKHYVEALADADTVIKLSPSSHRGPELKHAALDGVQQSDKKTNETFESMLSKLKLTDASDSQIQALRQQYTKAEHAIRGAIDTHLEKAPLRLLNTSNGRLCNQDAQRNDFMESKEYSELLYSSMTHTPLQIKPIKKAVAKYFGWVMLSHRWNKEEPAMHDIQGKDVYELKGVANIEKLQMFCKKAHDLGYHWAWSDTCCIDQKNTAEVQRSVNSMFVWYRHSALTIVYLSDVSPSVKSGALENSVWTKRGWTVQEFLAPDVILFYHRDWDLYLDDRSPNHKKSPIIMMELERSTSINARALANFNPGMRGAREKLQWASRRVTTVQEDIAYSLFGIFGVQLPVLYGEMKQSAMGRLLQEIVARSGDITALDWVGQPSEFNSCLPAEITSYATPPHKRPPISAKDMQKSVSKLQKTVTVESALKLYTLLDTLSSPRFANSRLHLPCITFTITEVKQKRDEDQGTLVYRVKADGLQDLSIITEDKLVQFSPTRPTPQTFLLVCPWNRHDFGLPDFANGAHSMKEQEQDDLDFRSRAFKLIARLGQPFNALLLAQQRGSEYKRIASDHSISAEVKSTTAVHDMMDVKMLEIL